MSRLVSFCLLFQLALGGCSSGPIGGPTGSTIGPSGEAGRPSAARETQIACRQRVNEMYDRRDRADLYTTNGFNNLPYSANYQSGISSRGLANQFDYERTRVECENTSGTGAERTEAPARPGPKTKAR